MTSRPVSGAATRAGVGIGVGVGEAVGAGVGVGLGVADGVGAWLAVVPAVGLGVRTGVGLGRGETRAMGDGVGVSSQADSRQRRDAAHGNDRHKRHHERRSARHRGSIQSPLSGADPPGSVENASAGYATLRQRVLDVWLAASLAPIPPAA